MVYVTSLLKSGEFCELPQTSVSFSQVFSQNHIIPRLVAIKIAEMVSHHIHILCAKLFYHLILSSKSSNFYLIYLLRDHLLVLQTSRQFAKMKCGIIAKWQVLRFYSVHFTHKLPSSYFDLKQKVLTFDTWPQITIISIRSQGTMNYVNISTYC